jgi:hypothetical protein
VLVIRVEHVLCIFPHVAVRLWDVCKYDGKPEEAEGNVSGYHAVVHDFVRELSDPSLERVSDKRIA